MLYETLLLVGVTAMLFLFPHLLAGMFFHHVASPALLAGHLFLLLMGYFVWFWQRDGQTLAMKTWRIRLVDGSTGHTAGYGQCLLRYSLAWPSLLLGGVGILWALVDKDRQFLHDRIAGTRIQFEQTPG